MQFKKLMLENLTARRLFEYLEISRTYSQQALYWELLWVEMTGYKYERAFEVIIWPNNLVSSSSWLKHFCVFHAGWSFDSIGT